MNEKSIKILEYHKIIELLISFAKSPLGKVKCETLSPSIKYEEIIKSQKETTDACARIRMKGNLNFSGARDVISSVKRLEIGGFLSMPELLNIAKLLENAKKARDYGFHEEEEEGDSLEEYFTSLIPLRAEYMEIFRCILSEDSMADEASSKLSSIRRQKKNIQSRIHSELNAVLNANRDFLMDAVITMRNGAYCLPVKAEYKNKFQGIVHDQSATGSTIFIEPMASIKMNNEIRELEIEEKAEIEVILERLSQLLLPYTTSIENNMKVLAHLDFVYAKANLSRYMKAEEPKFNTKHYINIKDGRHPLIAADKVVPINISLGREYDLLIVTGPNTGGKTVSLKTVGLFTLMGQAGLHIPAFAGSELSVFEDVYADIGDEQSIEQSLSTFSGHMKRIVEILEHADANSLCLFDELGAGTDPTEGAALAIAILKFLHNMQTRTIATTHYSELKVFALETAGVENASCEFDIQTLKPTYRILIGVPGKSNAFAISQKLGLPEFIIEEAGKLIDTENKSFEDLLTKLEDDRIELEKVRLEVEKSRAETEQIKKKFRNLEHDLEKRKEKIIEDAKKEASRILENAKEVADTSIKNINKIASGAGLGKALEKERENLRQGIKDNQVSDIKPIKKAKPVKPHTLVIGDAVRILSMNLNATVASLPNDKGNLFVQAGILRTQVNIKDIEYLGKQEEEKKTYQPSKRQMNMKAAYISPEINVIGMNVDEACATLEKYLDDALLSHLASVRIIHGRGTGALYKGIHQFLKRQNFIKSFALADFEDGGDAITIVKF